MNRPTMALGLALVLLLGACARGDTGPWDRSGASETALSRQTAECRAEAREYVDREIAIQPSDRDLIRPQDSRTVQGAFTRMDLKKTHDRVFGNCMRAAGYSQPPK